MTEENVALVVDDSATQAMQMQALLEAAGYTVRVAANGAEALASIRSSVPKIVVTDLHMPEMNGLELVEAVRDEFPSLPVLLTTAKESEEVTLEALRKGAASYVPKKYLELDLVDTVRRVLAIAQTTNTGHRFAEMVTRRETDYSLVSDDAIVPDLIAQIENHIVQMGLCDEGTLVQVATALDEALVNAIVHGNLEVSSKLREIDDGRPYAELIQKRRTELPYRDRRVNVSVKTTREEAVFAIRDEGPGFDPKAIDDPTDPANLEKVCGRGLLLINAFMDEVYHNDVGNEITMIKRRVVRDN